MKILGLNVSAVQTAAAVLDDGEIRFAAAEERFNRMKLSRAFPKQAIQFCLGSAGLQNIEDLDAIAISWNPAENMRQINLSGFTSSRRYDPEWLYIVPNNLMSQAGADAFSGEFLKMELGNGQNCPIYYVSHHHSHLAHAICQSPFEAGMAAAVDEYGEFNSVTIAKFSDGAIQMVKQIPYPNSLGVFYSAVTEYLGFKPYSDEWKVMGASAYGNPASFDEKLEQLIIWDEESADWVLDARFIEHSNMKRAGYLNERLVKFMGLDPRKPTEDLCRCHYDLAASAQAVFEKRLFQLLAFFSEKIGATHLAASGGCFMNSLANGKIVLNSGIKQIFIPYAAADNGGAMGAALYVWHYVLGNKRVPASVSPSPYLGPEFGSSEVESCLEKYKLPYRRVDNIAQYAAGQVAAGKLVGWFQGRMEFGERALGNRSIIADPRDAAMKEKINSAVKYREAFRPFAPSIMSDRTEEYFVIPDGVFVPYMEQVYPFKEERKKDVPAVVHNDGTGRLQMVSKELNPLFYELIGEFDKLTGIPIVLNTSFNVQGEPIVCSPTDAVRTFYSCGLDVLVLDKFVLEK